MAIFASKQQALLDEEASIRNSILYDHSLP